ncbi:MAG TPA: nucleotide exchange factor GrpE [Polyangiaceae bacterium]|nr:nucleotide exchange factor GrpE [Polyangiaceae bacterium]
MQGEPRQNGGAHDDEGGSDAGDAEPSSETSSRSSPSVAADPSAGASDPLAAAQAEATRFKDAWLRSAADFDNFRKRTRRELEEARRGGREDLLKTLMPVFDNLERAIQSSQRAADVKAVADGLSMVQRQFVDALGREGITRIPTIGRPFDPGVHEAIQQVETADHAPGTVIAEVQPGYTQGDRLVRAAMVVVAKPKSDDGGAPSSNDAAS